MIRALLVWSLAHCRAVIAAAVVIAIVGILLIPRFAVDVLPDITRPTLVIMTEAAGLASEEVEDRVTRPVEVAMAGLPGALRVRSSTIAAVSIVSLELDWGTHVGSARQLAAERLAQVRDQLPPGVSPQIQPVTSIMGEIMLVAVTGPGLSGIDLRTIADRRIRPRMAALPGVSQVTVIGGGAKEILVTPNLAALVARDVTTAELAAALVGAGANTSGGIAPLASGGERSVRAIAATGPAPFADAVVATRDGRPVLVREVAAIAASAAPARGSAGVDGGDAVILSVQKQPAVDTLRLTADVDGLLSSLSTELRPSGASVRVLFRQADFITTGLANVQRLLIEASIIVALVLLVLLGGWRPTLVSLVAIPLALITAALALHVFGLGIDVMILGGFAIALGELVDDAVVDVENVTRALRRNAELAIPRPTGEVVLDASLEVRSGLVQATAIIALVLVPLLLVPGVEGRLLWPLALAYITAMAASLVVALTLTPVLCTTWLGGASAHVGHEPILARRLRGLVAEHLPRAFVHRRAVLGGAAALVAVGVLALVLLPRALMPAFNEGALTVTLSSNPGIGVADANRLGAAAERLLASIAGVRATGRRTGRAAFDEHTQGVETSEIDVVIADPRRRADMADEIRRRLAVLPARVSVGQPIAHRIDHMTTGLRAQFALKLYGRDLAALEAAAFDLQGALTLVPGLVDIGVERIAMVPTLDIHPDPARAALWGVAPARILETAELSAGKLLTTTYEDGFRVDVVLRLADADRTPERLSSLLVETADGRAPLSAVADVLAGITRTRIEREDGERRLALTANFEGDDTAATLAGVRDVLDAVPLPPGVHAAVEGTFVGQAEAVRRIGWAFAAVLAVVFAGLAYSYRSARLAAIVLGSVPLAFVGGAVALLVSGQPLSLAATVGFVALAGIATRNGILKVSHVVDRVRVDGRLFGPDVVVEAGRDRVVPVAITALAAAMALLPILLGGSAMPGAELLYPVAAVVFGGLLGATVLDAVVTPVLLMQFAAPAFETASG